MQSASARSSPGDYIAQLERSVTQILEERVDLDRISMERGLPPFVLRELLAAGPLAAFVPAEHGGRGAEAGECLRVLEVLSYASLPLGLLVAISGGLFLMPIAKYGQAQAQTEVFAGALGRQQLGGLMITEPAFGSDALNIQTSFVACEGGYQLRGVKHWAGLTGWADAWLIAARERKASGALSMAPSLFICDSAGPGQGIEVEERFPNLGLYAIPYGRSRLDLQVPRGRRLEAPAGGLIMFRDLLHRTRELIAGLALGFLRRVQAEAARHCEQREVGGRKLIDYDLVQARLARMQGAVTAASAMCLYASEHAGLQRDLSGEVIMANAIKAYASDLMHAGAQSLVQLSGAEGYRLDRFPARALVDSRPFQIFEGSNDILYKSVGEAVVRGMRRARVASVADFLAADPRSARAAKLLGARLELRVEGELRQRRLWSLGALVSRVCALELVIELGDRGYSPERVEVGIACLVDDIEAQVTRCRSPRSPTPAAPADGPGWSAYARPARSNHDRAKG